MNRIFAFSFLVLVLSGCAPSNQYRVNYQQVSPENYSATFNVWSFQYQNLEIEEVYELLYPNFQVIGKSTFSGNYYDPASTRRFAKSVGSDVFIATRIHSAPTASISPDTDTNQLSPSGYIDADNNYQYVVNYRVQETDAVDLSGPVSYQGMFLKNVSGMRPLWQRNRDHYKETEYNTLTGIWENKQHRLRLYQSGEQLVMVLKRVIDAGKKNWKEDDVKMVFNLETGVGVYLDDLKTPMPVKVAVNRFGHIEVNDFSNNNLVAFDKVGL